MIGFKHFSFVCLCVYALLFFFFLIVGKEGLPAPLFLSFQIVAAVGAVAFVGDFNKGKDKQKMLFWGVLGYQLISLIVLRLILMELYDNPLGYKPVDAFHYHQFGVRFNQENLLSLGAWLDKQKVPIDDYGFPIILLLTYRVFGAEVGIHVLCLLNAVIIATSAFFLYKLARKFLEQNTSLYVSALWGVMPFSTYIGAVGLKENFFVALLVSAFYFYYKFIDDKKLINLILALILGASTFFFRLAVGYIIFLSFASYILYNSKRLRRYSLSLSFLAIVIGLLLFEGVSSFIMEQQGYSYRRLLAGTQDRLEEMGGVIGYVTNLASSLIGPFPNFVSSNEKINYITIFSFTLLVKMLISPFAIWSMVKTIKQGGLLIPVVTFFFLNSLMLLVTFWTLDPRMQWPHIPFVFLLFGYGYETFVASKKRYFNRMLSPKVYNQFYIVLVVFLVIIFNFR